MEFGGLLYLAAAAAAAAPEDLFDALVGTTGRGHLRHAIGRHFLLLRRRDTNATASIASLLSAEDADALWKYHSAYGKGPIVTVASALPPVQEGRHPYKGVPLRRWLDAGGSCVLYAQHVWKEFRLLPRCAQRDRSPLSRKVERLRDLGVAAGFSPMIAVVANGVRVAGVPSVAPHRDESDFLLAQMEGSQRWTVCADVVSGEGEDLEPAAAADVCLRVGWGNMSAATASKEWTSCTCPRVWSTRHSSWASRRRYTQR